ncbi:Rid family hydrolase [Pelagicoccus sp. SDUM812003]|uniref:Rid family hydrolase n=1 Tax=Pelagicoccus sp. SDUM812003 TaxID=3041267 RepID=UPI00280CF4F1|nr:Rid family hydrolase [Pelagicoccus sp. SDUM812003]MDQ8202092.1 Rid family hydrolase [Pelagicoccus sp. SDUM812003]
MIQTYIKPKLTAKLVERETYSDYYITVESPNVGAVEEQVAAIYAEAIELVVEKEIQVLQEKIHGSADALDAFCKAREKLFEKAGLDKSLPFTYVEGRPLDGQDIVSLQIWGIVAKSDSIKVEKHFESETPSFLWKTKDFELLYSPQIHGYDEKDKENKPNVTDQCQTMFERCSSVLDNFGMDFKRVARTWIYCRRLLDWYGELNRVRTEHFKKAGIFSTGKPPVYPASTGIQGRFGNEECFLDLLAVKNVSEKGIEMTPIVTTSRQHQAFGYGSAFSRGMVLTHEGYRTVYVSGTASINTAGESTYIGNAEIQALDTLMNIAALLEDQGGSLKDIHMGVVYCKTQEVYQDYKRALRLLGIPEMPLVCVEADVCRHELLIEIELVAVIKDGDSNTARWQP